MQSLAFLPKQAITTHLMDWRPIVLLTIVLKWYCTTVASPL